MTFSLFYRISKGKYSLDCFGARPLISSLNHLVNGTIVHISI
jgi:hypothetical protein